LPPFLPCFQRQIDPVLPRGIGLDIFCARLRKACQSLSAIMAISAQAGCQSGKTPLWIAGAAVHEEIPFLFLSHLPGRSCFKGTVDCRKSEGGNA
jgi:hypothetical protein